MEKSIATEAKRVENTEFELQDVPRDGDCGYWAFIGATGEQGIELFHKETDEEYQARMQRYDDETTGFLPQDLWDKQVAYGYASNPPVE